jgi:lipopolysaccharide biosynthesis regulator YciM
MVELLFLLLPIAAAYGWYMGRRSAGHQHQRDVSEHSKNYFAGLNYLLSDEPDKAVDQFISLVEVDNETIETHLALGRLFRQRGEVDRSLRIHQNLLARPSLTNDQRDTALFELGNDYLQAGLIDRSTNIFIELSENKTYKDKSLSHLVCIYQKTKEWQQAIDTSRLLVDGGNRSLIPARAHFYCELYEANDKSNNVELLKRALQVDAGCTRARLLLGNYYFEHKRYADCQLVIDQFLAQDIDFFREAITLFERCYEKREQLDLFEIKLNDAIAKGAGIATLLAKLTLVGHRYSAEEIEKLLMEHLIKSPSVIGFYHLMSAQLDYAENGKAKDSLIQLRTLVNEQLKIRPVYRCVGCGFSAKKIQWQCPSCLSWGSVKPIRGLDGD